MKKYEYKIVKYKKPYTTKDLNKEGKEGWEFVDYEQNTTYMIKGTDSSMTTNYEVLYKREL